MSESYMRSGKSWDYAMLQDIVEMWGVFIVMGNLYIYIYIYDYIYIYVHLYLYMDALYWKIPARSG